jgi:hypothetical protein
MDLPPGCSIDVELDAVDLLRRLLPRERMPSNARTASYEAARGERPTIGAVSFRLLAVSPPRGARGAGSSSSARRTPHGRRSTRPRGGARMVPRARNDGPREVFQDGADQALIELDGLRAGVALTRLRIAAISSSPLRELFRDIEDVKDFPTPGSRTSAPGPAYWRKNPVRAWTGTPAARSAGSRSTAIGSCRAFRSRTAWKPSSSR